MAPDESEDDYYREYYDENRDEILQQRKEKYENDEEYRKQVKEESLRRYHENKGETKQPGRDEGPNKPRVFNEEVCISTGELMEKIDKAVARPTILKWTRQGIIPEDGYYESAGDMKWWRPRFVKFLVNNVNKRDDYSALDEWKRYLHGEWTQFKND